MQVSINHSSSNITIYRRTSSKEAHKHQKDGQRRIDVRQTSVGDVLTGFLSDEYMLKSEKSSDDILLDISLNNIEQEIGFVYTIHAILGQKYELFLDENLITPYSKRIYSPLTASLELLYDISREIASTLDLHQVLRRVLALSMRTIGAVSGSIIVLNRQGKPVDSAIIYQDEFIDHSTSYLDNLVKKGLAGWVLENRQPALVINTKEDERWLARSSDDKLDVKAKSALSVPLIAREEFVGAITLSHPVPQFWTEDHLTLVQAIADQSAVAVVNARLYEASQQQARVMGAVAKSATAITSTLNLDQVLEHILEQIDRALMVEMVSLALIDEYEECLVYKASSSLNKSMIGMRVELGAGIAGWVAEKGKGIIVPNVQEDPRFDSDVDQWVDFESRAIACAPIRSQGKLIGVLQAINPLDGTFGSDALLVLTGIGSLAGTAIQHAQLFEDLQNAHRRYRDLFNNSIDAILVTDWEGEIIEANRQTMIFSGYDQEDIFEKNIRAIHDLDIETIGQNLEELLPGETLSYESVLHTIEGKHIPIQVHVHLIQIAGEAYPQWTFRDITERKKLDQMRDDFLSMIYHELRTPLSSIQSCLEYILANVYGPLTKKQRRRLEIALESTGEQFHLINNLLDLVRIDEDRDEIEQKWENISEVVTNVLNIFEYDAEKKDIQLKIDFSIDQSLEVFMDVSKIKQVLSNLVSNALKFTPSGGSVSLFISKFNDILKLQVQDTGIGIEKSEHDAIFNRFHQVDSSLTREFGGLGIGLHISKNIVEQHGGKIYVEDSRVGEGTTITFTLPLQNIKEK